MLDYYSRSFLLLLLPFNFLLVFPDERGNKQDARFKVLEKIYFYIKRCHFADNYLKKILHFVLEPIVYIAILTKKYWGYVYELLFVPTAHQSHLRV